MNRPLFVHSSQKVLDRVSKESNAHALVTPSMVQALQWITNPEIEISGIFLNPDDPTFSAFRFLEITLNHRPVVPIFLFESHLSRNHEGGQRVMKSTHVRGIFSGAEPYATLVSSLKSNVADSGSTRRKLPEANLQPGYISLPITDFFTGSHYPYNIFILGETNDLRLFAQKDSAIDSNYLEKAAQKTQYLFVKEEDIQKNKSQLKETQSQFLENIDYPTEWKTSEIMVNAKNVLNEMKKSGMNDSLIEYTQGMLGDLFKLIAKMDSDAEEEGSLFGMIDKAKQCDRSVFCASYAMLICKQLRFEKTATLEILGLASVLQDISLYQTPYGDLSDKLPQNLTAEQLTYYTQHPTLSADMIAQHTDVPQVTLQVVRQHHERKDKSGFPNRVGGLQLHPMAEILSLINSYYEVTKVQKNDAEAIQTLGKDAFPHFSENIVNAFKQVLGNILKDKIHAAHSAQAL
jgi:HD-GYP domain-containing protein (c-di-GMP phosphodiesterase class II)